MKAVARESLFLLTTLAGYWNPNGLQRLAEFPKFTLEFHDF